MPNTKKKYKTNKTVKACRICLAMDRKMYNMKKYNLSAYYEDVTGINVTKQKNALPHKLCWECSHRLVVCNTFRNKALRSHALMTELLEAAQFITSKSLSTIDREINSLTTNLTSKIFETDSDIIIQHSTIDIELTRIDIPEIKDENDMKKESEGYSSSDEILSKRNDVLPNETLSKNVDIYSSSEEILSKNVGTVKVDRRRRPAKDVLNQDIVTITDLSYDEQLYEISKRMDSANYKNSEYKCNECYKGFLDAEAFKLHMARHSDISGIYKCEICKIRFKKQHALRNHTTSHMQKFNCKQCPYVTTRRHAAKLHEDFHNGTKYQCPHCQESFVKISTYMSHVRIKHPSDFVCELCGYSFVSAKGLGLHKKLKHRFEEHAIPKDGPSCVQCAVNFISKEALDNHLTQSSKHNNISNPRQRVNKTHGSRNDKLSLDKKTKRGNCAPKGPIPCEQCDLQLPDSLAYYRHFRRSHPDKNRTNYPSMKSKSMCEVCGKMFQSVALLQDHSSTHTDSKQFRCVVCDKQFQRQYRLIAHRRVHLTHRMTHACRVCDKRFTTASNMQRHMFSHTGLKPFKCEMCGKGFKHASEKRVHITYVHLKKPWPKRTKGKKMGDGRQDQPSQSTQPNANCLDLVQPLWPASNDPKIPDTTVDDKSMYYKI